MHPAAAASLCVRAHRASERLCLCAFVRLCVRLSLGVSGCLPACDACACVLARRHVHVRACAGDAVARHARADARRDARALAQVVRLLENGAFGAARVDWLVQVLTEYPCVPVRTRALTGWCRYSCTALSISSLAQPTAGRTRGAMHSRVEGLPAYR